MGKEINHSFLSVVLALVILISAFTILAPSVRGQDFINENFDLMETITDVGYNQNFPASGTGYLTSSSNPVGLSQAEAHSGSQSVLFDVKYDVFSYVGVYNNGYLSFWFYLTNTSTIQPTITMRVDSTLADSGYTVLTIARTTDSNAHFVLQSNDWDEANETLRAIGDIPTNTWTRLSFELNDTTETYLETTCYVWDVWLNDEPVGYTPIEVDAGSMGYLDISTFKLSITRAGSTGSGASYYIDDLVISDTAPSGGGPSPPDATFTADPSSGFAPLQVTFTPTDLGYEGYNWTFGDGNTSTAANPNHTFQQPGTYNVTLNVTNDGMYDESWEIVNVNLEPEITSTPVTNGTVGGFYTYAPSCNVPVPYWTMDTDAGFLSINASTGVVSGEIGIEDNGFYGVMIHANTDPVCNQEYVLEIDPLEWNTTVIIAVTKTNLHVSVSYTLSDPSVAWAVENVTWNFGDGSTNQTGASVDHTYATAGTYTVTCTVTNVLGNDTVGTKNITVSKASTTTPPKILPPGGSSGGSSGGDSGTSSGNGRLLIILVPLGLILLTLPLLGMRSKKGRRRT